MTGSSPEERRGRESHTTGSPDVTEKIGTSEKNIHMTRVNFASSCIHVLLKSRYLTNMKTHNT